MKRIIYIMGAGRSGSTLLDIILGNNPGIRSAGELNRYTRSNGIPRTENADDETAKFWAAFRKSLAGRMKVSDFTHLHELVDRHEYHSAFFRLLFQRNIRPAVAYANYLESFFKTLFEMADANTVVDSSKYPMRGYFMSITLPYEISYIYLKRQPAEVIRSFSKRDVEQPYKGWLMTNLYLLSIHSICARVTKRLMRKHKLHILHYDQLVDDPVTALESLSAGLNLNLRHSIELIKARKPLVPGLLFEGNRLRMEKEIYIRKAGEKKMDFTWRERLAGMAHRCWWP